MKSIVNPEKIVSIINWGIAALMGSLIFSLFLAQAIAVILLLLWIYKLSLTGRTNLKKNPFIYPFIAFIVVRLISVLFSSYPSESLQILNKEIIFYSLFFIILDVFPVTEKSLIKSVLWVLVTAALISAVYGTGKVFFGFEDRASSTTSGYSTLGMFLTAVIAIILPLGNNKEFFSSKWIWYLCIIIIGIGILFTFNRIHWAITGLLFFIIGLIRERKALFIGVGIAALLIIIVPSLTERFQQLIFFTQSYSDRDVIWEGAFLILFQHPFFGFGPRTFHEIFPLFEQLADKGISSWHCDYLQVYMESGILGLLVFLWIVFIIFFYLTKILRNKEFNSFYNDLTFALILSMISFYLTATVGGFIFDPVTSLLFQFLLALTALLVNLSGRGVQKKYL